MLVVAKADIERAAREPPLLVAVPEVAELPGAVLLRPLEPRLGASAQQLFHGGRHGALVAMVEKEISVFHPGPDALEDFLRRVVRRVVIEIAAPSVLIRLPGHADAHVDVVGPSEHRHAHPLWQMHVDHVPLPVGGRLVHGRALRIVGDGGQLRDAVGAWKVSQDRVPVHGDRAVLEGPDLDDVAFQEWPADGDLVRRCQALCEFGSLVAALDPHCLALHDPKLALAIERWVSAIKGPNMGVSPEDALARDLRLRRRRGRGSQGTGRFRGGPPR
mmetsp:Transcript_110150/g.215942  ORF Transcript_110150/g.215942 Transcript_110150/m.215942 type:complete len:274 (+) Transcript_110150:139-960(+)